MIRKKNFCDIQLVPLYEVIFLFFCQILKETEVLLLLLCVRLVPVGYASHNFSYYKYCIDEP